MVVPGTVALTLGRSLNGKRTLLRGRKDPDDGWWSLTGCPVGTSQRTVMSCGCDPKGGQGREKDEMPGRGAGVLLPLPRTEWWS